MPLMLASPDRPRGGGMGRLLIALVVAAVSVFSYLGTRSTNPTTGQVQHVGITPDQEIALGLQATPEMEQQYGGLSQDARASARVAEIGRRVVAKSEAEKSPYRYDFHLLADPQTINAFALPGGQVFITKALYDRLQTDGQLAGVLGHEVGHVVARHSAQHIAKARLTQGLTGAAVIATYNPNDPRSSRNAAVAAMIGQLVNLRFDRNDELQADGWGVDLMSQSGYDPRSMTDVMKILQEAEKGGRQPEFFSTHPNPGHRMEQIQADIQKDFPQGVPGGLQK